MSHERINRPTPRRQARFRTPGESEYNAGMKSPSIQNGRRVFQGVRFDLYAVEQSLPDGGVRRREIVVHPGAVVVLPMLDPQTIVMIRNQRIAVDRELWELPAGTLEPPPETPLSCAGRELIEETGYRAGRIEPLTQFYSSPGITDEAMHCFLATDLSLVGQDLDEGESITAHPMPLTRALEMVRSGEIQDAKTIATLLYFHCFQPPAPGTPGTSAAGSR